MKLKPSTVAAMAEIEPFLEDGDVIFIRIANLLYRQVAKTSASWESHVGMIFREPNGEIMVAESTVPRSKRCPWATFIGRSEGQRFEIKRCTAPLSSDEKAGLKTAAAARMGVFYHLGFKFDSPRLYCSKFVYETYLTATGREIGRIQTFRALLEENPQAPMPFWRLWFFGFVPWKRRCITTTSQLRDPSLHTIARYGVEA